MTLLARFGLILLVAGCSREVVGAFEVSGLDSPLVQPGDALEFSGRRFPTSQPGSLSLRGELRSSGSESRTVSASLPVEVMSPERIRVPITGEVSQLVRTHSLFRGSAVLRFERTDGSHSVAKLDPMSIEWAGEGESEELQLAGERTAHALGFDLSEPANASDGFRIARLDRDGQAASAGLRSGEWIDSVDGLPLRSSADLVPPPAAGSLTLELRDALGARRTVALGLGRGLESGWDGLRSLLWICPAALALLFFGPWPSPSQWLVRARARSLAARPEVFGVAGLTARSAMVLLTAAACCLGAWGGARWTLGAALVSYVALLALRLVLPVVLRSGALWTRRTWLAARRSSGWALLLAFALASSSLLSGDATLAPDPATWPWAWSLFARPPLWLAAWIWAQCALRLHSGARGWVDDTARIALAVITASLWLGGPGDSALQLPAAWQLGLGSLLLACKTLAVLALLAVLPRMAAQPRRTILRVAGVCAALSGVWLWLAPGRALELRIGSAAYTTFALAALAVLVELRSSSWPVGRWLRAARERRQEMRERARAADAERLET